jgi:hypothetical protein
MKVRYGALITAFLTLAFAVSANAQTIWMSQKKTASTWNGQQPLGIEIASDTWSDTDPEFADKTYQAFKGYQASQHTTLGADDYYYRLKLAVPSKFLSTDADCRASPFLQTLANGFFGYSKAGLILINSNISYEPAIGANTPLITDKTPLLMFSQGASAGAMTPGNGCYLKETTNVDFPIIRFENGDISAGKEVFHVNFDVSTGSQLQSNFVSNALALFSSANTAFHWNAALGTATDLATKGAAAFDKAINSAGTFQSESPINITLKQKNVVYLRIPAAYGKQRLVEMFPYVSGSILLPPDNGLKPSSVLSNVDLAFKTCTLTAIASGSCSPKTARSSILSGDYVTRVIPANYIIPLSLFDPDGKPELVLPLCNALRLQLDETMRISTLDQMVVRWAFTKESHLQDALLDPTKSQKLVAAAKVTDIKPIKDACWNDGDNLVLSSVTKALNIRLKDNNQSGS